MDAFLQNPGPVILVLVLGSLFVGQLWTGRALGGRMGRSVYRETEPRAYWIRMVGFAAFSVFMLWYAVDEEAQHQAEVKRAALAEVALGAAAAHKVVSPREQADRLHRSNQFDSAIVIYDALIAAAPTDTGLLTTRGLAHWRANHLDLALADFRRVIAIDGTNFTVHQHADRILSSQARWGETIALWDNFIARNPNHAGAYFERGGTHFHKGDRAAALADADKSCQLGNRAACDQAARLRD